MAKHIIAVIGSGGKTTAMGLLARQAGEVSVLATTSTHIFPMGAGECDACLIDPAGEELLSALGSPGIVCAGTTSPQGKLTALPADTLKQALQTADVAIYEADGSKGLPLKLHRPDEPVLLGDTTRVLVVAGLSALGKPLCEVVHRWELRADWKDTPARLVDGGVLTACVLETADSAGVPYGRIRVFLNQADACAYPDTAREIAAQLQNRGLQTHIGSLRDAPEGLFRWVVNK